MRDRLVRCCNDALLNVATVKGDKDRKVCQATSTFATHDKGVGQFGPEIASESHLACPDSPCTSARESFMETPKKEVYVFESKQTHAATLSLISYVIVSQT